MFSLIIFLLLQFSSSFLFSEPEQSHQNTGIPVPRLQDTSNEESSRRGRHVFPLASLQKQWWSSPALWQVAYPSSSQNSSTRTFNEFVLKVSFILPPKSHVITYFIQPVFWPTLKSRQNLGKRWAECHSRHLQHFLQLELALLVKHKHEYMVNLIKRVNFEYFFCLACR